MLIGSWNIQHVKEGTYPVTPWQISNCVCYRFVRVGLAYSGLQCVGYSVWWSHVPLVEQVLGVTSKELIPKGTRFGPLVGESYTNEMLLKDANRKYFWRVSELHVSRFVYVACEFFFFLFYSWLHPVSPSGDDAVAAMWHKLAVVVNVVHPVKRWLSLSMLGLGYL